MERSLWGFLPVYAVQVRVMLFRGRRLTRKSRSVTVRNSIRIMSLATLRDVRTERQTTIARNAGEKGEKKMSENFAFPIPNNVLEPYIKAAVSSAIESALGDGTEVIKKAVTAALATKVDMYGDVSGNSYNNKYNLIEVLATRRIQEIAKKAVNDMAEKLRPAIERQVREQIMGRSDEISKMLVDGLIGSLQTSWSIKVMLNPHDN